MCVSFAITIFFINGIPDRNTLLTKFVTANFNPQSKLHKKSHAVCQLPEPKVRARVRDPKLLAIKLVPVSCDTWNARAAPSNWLHHTETCHSAGLVAWCCCCCSFSHLGEHSTSMASILAARTKSGKESLDGQAQRNGVLGGASESSRPPLHPSGPSCGPRGRLYASARAPRAASGTLCHC